jgi:hypothetical protein
MRILVILILFLGSCSLKEEEKEKRRVSFFDPENYYIDTAIGRIPHKVLFTEKFFFLIGEEGFIGENMWDFYLVYMEKNWPNSDVNIVSIKSLERQILATKKTITLNDNNLIFDAKHNELPQSGFLMNAVCQFIIQQEEFFSIKKYLDSVVRTIPAPGSQGISERYSVVLYYTGDRYYVIDDYFVSQGVRRTIDSMFLNASFFKM